jgi:hypothetical protein
LFAGPAGARKAGKFLAIQKMPAGTACLRAGLRFTRFAFLVEFRGASARRCPSANRFRENVRFGRHATEFGSNGLREMYENPLIFRGALFFCASGFHFVSLFWIQSKLRLLRHYASFKSFAEIEKSTKLKN